MLALSPSEVHKFASFVYKTEDAYEEARSLGLKASGSIIQNIAKENLHVYSNNANFSSKPRMANHGFISASAGIFSFKKLTGFGFIAELGGNLTGELVLATRGTSNSFDIGTDANIGWDVGPGGHLVHRGFCQTFNAYKAQLREFINARRSNAQPIRTVHCIGHSLGGALANLNAAALLIDSVSTHLYTIGAPRVGMVDFAYKVTKQMPEARNYRVSNSADPVAMLPVFPFIHASKAKSEYVIKTSWHISASAHKMDDGYISMSRVNDWNNMTPMPAPELDNPSDLSNKLAEIGGGASFSTQALQWIKSAIVALAKMVGYVGLAGPQFLLSYGVTAVDMLSQMLFRAGQIGKAAKEQAESVVRGVMQFLGRAKAAAVDLSVSFLSWLLSTFMTEIGHRARRAIEEILRGVR